MKVFVWVNYGDVEVRAAETIEQLELIYKDILKNLEDWGVEDDLAVAAIYASPGTVEAYIRAIRYLVEVGDDTESFEYGTGFTTVKGV
jgi:hypothetical protein